MNGSWFFDENFNGVPDDFFDDAINDFDVPLEDIEANDAGEDWQAEFQNLEPPPFNVLAGFSSGSHFENGNGTSKVMISSSISNDDALQLKQWPSSAEASSSGSIPLHCDPSEVKYPKQFRTSSPVSVLESSSGSCTGGNQGPHCPIFVPVKRPRSKFVRNRRQALSIFSFISAPRKSRSWGYRVSDSESHHGEHRSNPANRRQKKRKNLVIHSSDADDEKSSAEKPGVEIRKCTHCQVTKTPQWREGPLGPKTLCNACGVRYRSGRLLPEYRPAASPTFVASLHSNSHRKVLEMRKKTPQVTAADVAPVH